LLLILQIRVVVQGRHLRCEAIDRPAELIQSRIITVLAAALPAVPLAVVALEPRHARAVFRIVHRSTVHAGQARLPVAQETADVVEVFDGQHL